MKKILLIMLSCLLFVGCGKVGADDALKKFEKLVGDTAGYTIKGTMEILSNEERYNYNVEVAYRDGNYYKVNLTNTENSHEQIILKNEEGVFVVTPALNKSFKFQSEWPSNSSQAYILETLLKDLKSDGNRAFKEENDKYVFTTSVNYPNNSNLVSQKITFDKEMKPEKVEVFNEDGIAYITMTITNLDLKSKYEKDYFALTSNVDENCCNTESTETKTDTDTENTETTGSIDDIVYPMYLPVGTTFGGEEKVSNTDSQRVILTFTGEKPFIFIEEKAKASKDHETIGVNGELVSYGPILGVMTDTSINWYQNGMEYYVIGSNLSTSELLQIASSTKKVDSQTVK